MDLINNADTLISVYVTNERVVLIGQTLYHTVLLAPSLQGADPWSLLNPLINGVEGTWDQSTRRRR